MRRDGDAIRWAPDGLLSPGAAFGIRGLSRFTGTRVTVVEGCGKDGHGIVREVTYWFDENENLLALRDPTDFIDTTRGQEGRDLLEAAFIYISQCVSVEEALTDGFDAAAWCEAVEARRATHSRAESEA